MKVLPNTILYPERFKEANSARNDGLFDWSWTEGCFGQTNIKPMDVDGIVERMGQFLVFETKAKGAPLPNGQRYTLEAMHTTGQYTIMIIWGKVVPEEFEVWFPSGEKREYHGVEKAKEVVSRWFEYADGKRK